MPQLITPGEKKRLVLERQNLLKEEENLKEEASEIRRRRTAIKERLEKIKDAHYQAYLEKAQHSRRTSPTITGHLANLVSLWNQLPKTLTYPRIEDIYITENNRVQIYAANDHSSPIGGINNRGRVPSMPLGYTGIRGTIIIEFRGVDPLRGEYRHPFEDVWGSQDAIEGVYTGSGGSRKARNGNVRLGWECKVWLEDYNLIWNKIKDLKEIDGMRLEALESFLVLEPEDYPKHLDNPDIKRPIIEALE